MSWAPHVTVAAVIRHGDRYLMVEEMAEGRRVFNQPAGHLEPGESLLQAAAREVLEETARPFVPTGLIGVYRWEFSAADRTYLRFCFGGSAGEVVPDRALDPDILDTHWLTAAQIRARRDQLRSPLVLRCLEDALQRPWQSLDLLHDLR